MKKCFKCGLNKEISEFYRHPEMADGHLNKCKECTKLDSFGRTKEEIEKRKLRDRNRPNAKERVTKNLERIKRLKVENIEHYKKTVSIPNIRWNMENKHKKNAHGKVKRKLTMNGLKPNQCQLCGCQNDNLEGHHYDYSKPINVTWLCRRCHFLAHKAINEDKRKAS